VEELRVAIKPDPKVMLCSRGARVVERVYSVMLEYTFIVILGKRQIFMGETSLLQLREIVACVPAS
jgi:hypothetical protein